ncbi:MOSC-domain-containing protein [Dothidotthia symphoricarpi CBS 119687]|uniref:MOSC-domain-containing protein n=1 Tax=Dothidotthia symphoricarpi CBS 119687 TaxID=1392245 RepID=A0A6A6AFF0_9PLEO|nr:MOSC-domain-containing protein [Dothidotthia symphoricarpi CBS 119687]KAF2130286.1 MOSC-domain-containing protein [Dothidotthia symphoricarpi CBS 119687]
MALSDIAQISIVISVFFVPLLTFLFYTELQRKKSAGPIPPPTEITALYIHPIKSCHGISVQSARLLPTGLDLDRQWMWVSYPSYEFLTIRNSAKMTLIRPTYTEETDTLTITAPAPNSIDEKLEFSIPAHPNAAWLAQHTEVLETKIWNQWTPSNVYSTKITAPFDDFFGEEVRLVYKSPVSDAPRTLRSNGAKEVLGREASTCFPDLMPLLVANESSMNELNSRLKAAEDLTIDVRRFRPNILVKGNAEIPWDEDRWKTLNITSKTGSITLDVTQRCARCRVPNVNPETADEHKKEPWTTLMKYRRIDEGITFKPCFGMLCVPRETGELRVGMKFAITEVTDKHRYIAGF